MNNLMEDDSAYLMGVIDVSRLFEIVNRDYNVK